MNKQTPIVSIIIPIYNAGKYLNDTLKSVKLQTFTDWECICINDGSIDQSADIVTKFIANDKRFVLLEQTNKGVSVARNVGLEAASGKYIAFLDQDDLMSSTALESLVNLAEINNLNLVRGKRLNIPENYELNALADIKLTTKHKYIKQISVLKFRLLPKRWMYVWLCLFRRDFLNDIRFFEPLKSGAEDNIFMLEVFNKIGSFIQTDNIVCLHRKSLTSTTQNGLKLSHIQTIELAIAKFNELVNKNNNRLSRYIYKKQIRNFFRGSVYKSLESNQFIPETQAMLQNKYPDMKTVLKLKHRIIAHYYIRNKIKIAGLIKMLFVV